jgi:hypothetical protein
MKGHSSGRNAELEIELEIMARVELFREVFNFERGMRATASRINRLIR